MREVLRAGACACGAFEGCAAFVGGIVFALLGGGWVGEGSGGLRGLWWAWRQAAERAECWRGRLGARSSAECGGRACDARQRCGKRLRVPGVWVASELGDEAGDGHAVGDEGSVSKGVIDAPGGEVGGAHHVIAGGAVVEREPLEGIGERLAQRGDEPGEGCCAEHGDERR